MVTGLQRCRGLLGQVKPQGRFDVGRRLGLAGAGNVALPCAFAGDRQLVAGPVRGERALQPGLEIAAVFLGIAGLVAFEIVGLAERRFQGEAAETDALCVVAIDVEL